MRAGLQRIVRDKARLVSGTILGLAVLTGCSTTGTNFDASSLDLFVPGQTTLMQATALLKAEPTDVYRQMNGAAMARWAYRASYVPDALYFNRELWLAFDANGYFEHVVKSVNVPQAYQIPASTPFPTSSSFSTHPSFPAGSQYPGTPSYPSQASGAPPAS